MAKFQVHSSYYCEDTFFCKYFQKGLINLFLYKRSSAARGLIARKSTVKGNALLQNSSGRLEQDTEYTDVTLAEEEEHCLEAHKVVLTTASTAMAEQQLNICKHNQTGFCKLRCERQKTNEKKLCKNAPRFFLTVKK